MLFGTVGRFYKASPSADAKPKRASATSEEFPEIIGFDINDGLSRVAGNRKLYLKLLRQFLEQQGSVAEEIGVALGQGDVTLAERHAHTLKGVAGNIGAKAVQSAAGLLEKQIRQRAAAQDVESAKEQVAAALNPLIASLRTALPSLAFEIPASNVATAPPDPAQFKGAFAQLAKLLSEFDPGAVDFIEANRETIRPFFTGESWSEFEKLVQNYSFTEAHSQLQQVLKRQITR